MLLPVLLAHLSDLHLGCPPKRKRLERVKALIDRAIDDGIDHLLLGGDLVDCADLEDLQPLLDHLRSRGFFCSERLSVVPGNHDIWPFSESHLTERLPGILLDDLDSLLRLKHWPAQRRYEEFLSSFAGTFEGSTHPERDAYPCVKVIGNLAIALFDSTSNKGYFASAEGHFDREEGRFLRRVLVSHEGPRLLLMHHVPWRIGGFDMSGAIDELPFGVRHLVRAALDTLAIESSEFVNPNFDDLRIVRRFVRDMRFDAVLCGHVHSFDDDPRSRAFRRHVGEVPVFCMGRSGAVHQEWDDAVFAYDLVSVSGAKVQVESRYVSGEALD